MLAVTGLGDGQIVVLDAETLSERLRLEGRTATALGVPTFSADGRLLAAPDWDAQTVYVWDATGAIVEELVGEIGFPDVIWFGPDGSVHASTDDDTLITWNIAEDRHFVDRPAPAPPRPRGVRRAPTRRTDRVPERVVRLAGAGRHRPAPRTRPLAPWATCVPRTTTG